MYRPFHVPERSIGVAEVARGGEVRGSGCGTGIPGAGCPGTGRPGYPGGPPRRAGTGCSCAAAIEASSSITAAHNLEFMTRPRAQECRSLLTCVRCAGRCAFRTAESTCESPELALGARQGVDGRCEALALVLHLVFGVDDIVF